MHKAAIAIVALTIGSTGLFTSEAHATHRVALYQAANSYRDAVRQFERQVLRLPYMERADERLVDDLEDHTSVLRSASRHPENSQRFGDAWYKTQVLQSSVEAAIFGRACYPRNAVLERYWEIVLYQFAAMAEQVQCLYSHPRTSFPRVPQVIVPSIYPAIPVPVRPTPPRYGSVDNRFDKPTMRTISVRPPRVPTPSTPSVSIGNVSIPSRTVVVPSRSTFVPTPNTLAPSTRMSLAGLGVAGHSSVMVGANLPRLSQR